MSQQEPAHRGPRVSVIVPTKDRLDDLAKLFDGLRRQTTDDFEVVLIDDGSTADVQAFVGAERGDMDVVYLRNPGSGAVAARCFGIDHARGSILAFTDSDCEPEPGWVAEGIAAIDTGADVVQGRTIPARRVGLLERTISYAGGEGLFATCNMFYTRDAYESSGGFERAGDDRWRFRPDTHARGLGFGEDSLLGWMVARDGRFDIAPRAVVRHAVTRPSTKELFSRAWQVGAFPALVRDIPELKRTLLRSNLFLETRTRIPLYLAVIATLFGRWRIGAILVGLWAAHIATDVARRKDETVARRAAVVPIQIGVEATKAAALVVGSVRARTPVL